MGQVVSQCTGTIFECRTGRESSGNHAANSRVPTSSSSSSSKRIQSMIENRSNFSSEAELNIEFSKIHWSELSTDSGTDDASTRLANREYFQVLKNHPEWGGFFKDINVVLGEKISEGGQAEIYDAKVEFADGRKFGYGYHVVKLMKGNNPLQAFQRQWPVGMLRNVSIDNSKGPLMYIKGGTMIDNRFGFVMVRQWGDLRKLIDLKMQLNNNRGPPFKIEFVMKVMNCIAKDMTKLHNEYGIVHRDLKASNILLWSVGDGLPDENPHVKATVVDYECSVGVVGTGFWRAPEILQQLKGRVKNSDLEFTKMADIYSFGMICYELLTGCIPFEGYDFQAHDLFFGQERPNMLEDDASDRLYIIEIIKCCLEHEPLCRPTFSELLGISRLEPFQTMDFASQCMEVQLDSFGISTDWKRTILQTRATQVWKQILQSRIARAFEREEWARMKEKWGKTYYGIKLWAVETWAGAESHAREEEKWTKEEELWAREEEKWAREEEKWAREEERMKEVEVKIAKEELGIEGKHFKLEREVRQAMTSKREVLLKIRVDWKKDREDRKGAILIPMCLGKPKPKWLFAVSGSLGEEVKSNIFA